MRCFLISLIIVLNGGPLLQAQESELNWTHFRGSNLDGISKDSGFPVQWSDSSSNIAWKTEIPGRGWSSPVVYGNQVWCTSATEDGTEMFAYCIDFNTGNLLFKVKIFEPEEIFRKHSINSYATPTACIEEGFVYVHYGRYGTACLETGNGQIMWKRDDLHCKHVQGPGSSPVLYKNLIILHLEGTDQRYLAALDTKTGKTVWKVDRPEEPYKPLPDIGKKAYITPIIIRVEGRDLIISNGSAVCIAYEAQTGKEVWRVVKGAESTVAMPVESNGLVYFYTGFETSPEGKDYSELLAVDPVGRGDITGTNIRWIVKSPRLQLSTQVIKDGLLYTVDSESILKCMDAMTGETIWTERLKGKYNSSPVWADGKIYFSSTRGETTVIREGRSYERIALNTLDGEIWATPSFLRGSILLRTSKFLYNFRTEAN